jgi:hypothetical protein
MVISMMIWIIRIVRVIWIVTMMWIIRTSITITFIIRNILFLITSVRITHIRIAARIAHRITFIW